MASWLSLRKIGCAATLSVTFGMVAGVRPAHAQPAGSNEMCGDGTTFEVSAPSGKLTLPHGCRMYLLIVSDHGRNNQMNELTFYPLAKFVAENGGYVHWAWWNNLLREYMAGPLGEGLPQPSVLPPGPPPDPPSPLLLGQKFFTHPGSPALAYPGLIERDLLADGGSFLYDLLQPSLEPGLVGGTISPASPSSFVGDARAFLSTTRTQNPDALLFAVGHGFGAGSLNHVFEGITDVQVDLVGIIDPVGSENTPAGLRSTPSTFRGSQWRARRKFLGYRQADCIRNDTFPFLCKNHASGFFQWDFRCRTLGRPADTTSGWLEAPPLIASRAPLQCKGPVVHGGTLYRTSLSSTPNIRQIIYRTQPESRLPINPGQSPSPLLTCRDRNNADPILQAIVLQGAAEHEGALPVPEELEGMLNCNPDDGHDELIGDRGKWIPFDLNEQAINCEFDLAILGLHLPWWSALTTSICGAIDALLVNLFLEHAIKPGNTTSVTHLTGRIPLGSIVFGLGRGGLTENQEYLASIGRPTPTEAWPACAICDNGPVEEIDARNSLPLDMAYSANAESRRQALVSMATPGPWSFQPLIPELCLVCDELIEIASGMLDGNTSADSAAPTTTANVSPDSNADGWIAEDAVVVLTAADNPGGSGVRDISVSMNGAESGVFVHAGASAETSITTEGTTTVTFAARDNADNEEAPAQSLVVKIDKTAPTIETLIVPPPNALGWNSTDVTVTFSASDALSGLAEFSPTAPIVVTAEGPDQEIVGRASDLAGNESSSGPTISIDKSAPVIGLTSRTPTNAAGWNNTNVALLWNCSDALSGPLVIEVSQSVSAEGAAQKATATCMDRADHTASDTQSVNIDKTAPSVTISAPANGAVLLLNTNAASNYACSDGLSGVDSCNGPVPSGSPADTSSVGSKQFTVTASDVADNTASSTTTYTVLYGFSGFANPIAPLPRRNVVNAGRTVPVKYVLRDANGALITDPATFASLATAAAACDAAAPGVLTEERSASGSTEIRWDASAQQFIHNWKTDKAWEGSCRVLQLTLSDGAKHFALFQFK